MPLRWKKSCVGLALEATAGTFLAPDATPTTSTILPALNVKVGDIKPAFDGEVATRLSYMGDVAHYRSGFSREISFDLYLKGAAAAGTVPDWDRCMLACGMSKTVTAATSVAYKPATTMDGSTTGTPAVTNPLLGGYSIAVYEDGLRYAIAGAMGNVKFSWKAGECAMMSFSYQGVAQVDADIAVPTLSTLDTVVPVAFGATDFTVNFGTAWTGATFTELELDMGNQLLEFRDGNTSGGIKGFYIMDRKSTGYWLMDAVAVATQGLEGFYRASTTGSLVSGTNGSAAGNRYAVALNRVNLDAYSMAERESYRQHKWPFRLVVTNAAADSDTFTLTLT